MTKVKRESEKLDRILKYLDDNRSSFPDIQEVCEKCEIDYDKSLAIRLEHDGYIENVAKSKDGDGFRIKKAGEYFINIEHGYCSRLNTSSIAPKSPTLYAWAKEHSWLIALVLAAIGIIITLV